MELKKYDIPSPPLLSFRNSSLLDWRCVCTFIASYNIDVIKGLDT